ncbi:putative reverse transcriptase domain-containing protein [Tanacetum coccineum]
MEEMLYKFIDEGKREHDEMRAFICDFKTTNEILFKERNNSLIELRFGVQELLKVINNTPTIDCEVEGVTTRGGKTTTQDAQNNDTNVHIEEPHAVNHDKPVESDEVLTNDQPMKTTQELLANDEPDSFISRGLEKSNDQSDLEGCEPVESKTNNDSRLDKPIRCIASLNMLYPVVQGTAKPVEVEREHLYLASANEIDEKKPELKDLPYHLKYAYLHGDKSFPIIISFELSDKEKSLLLQVLEKRKGAIAWKDIKGISPSYCTHKILMEDDFKPVIQPQRHLNPKVQDVVKNEIVKLLDSGIIYPISDSTWVSPIHVVPKKGGMTVVLNDNNELIPHHGIKTHHQLVSSPVALEFYRSTRCSAVLLNKLPSKEKDLGSFTIPCDIGQLHINNALADLGASISLMPYTMYEKLGLGEPKATRMSLELADRSIQYPRGIIENVLIKVDKFILLIDFVILDMPEDSIVPIILRRPFLETAQAMIDIFNEKITLRVGDDEVIFDVDQSIKRPPTEDDECYGIDDLDDTINA